MQSKRFERGNPELRRMQSKRFERGDPELLANASRMEAAKVALSTVKSLQPHAMERAEVHGTSFSSQGMGDAMNAAVRRRCQHSGHRAHAAHKCCAQQRACIRAMSGGISRGHDRPGRAKHALIPKREEGQDGTLLWHVSGHSCGMYHVCGIKFLVHKYGLEVCSRSCCVPNPIVGRAGHVPQYTQLPTWEWLEERIIPSRRSE